MKTRFIAAIALGLTTASLISLPLAARANDNTTDYNYLGLGVGLGKLGSNDLGLSLNSKITVANHLSLRPGVITAFNSSNTGQTLVLAPLTYDMGGASSDGRLVPFVGAGLSVSTKGSGSVGPLITAGADYRLTDKVVANGTVHWSLLGDSQVNGSLGLGYIF
ncbi:MAG: hypothetical protein KGQ93_02210 [Cyanobacteria bacterium REEB459]|nr:hypothetical protein [Cyanobacteria bacterium REEB459]